MATRHDRQVEAKKKRNKIKREKNKYIPTPETTKKGIGMGRAIGKMVNFP